MSNGTLEMHNLLSWIDLFYKISEIDVELNWPEMELLSLALTTFVPTTRIDSRGLIVSSRRENCNKSTICSYLPPDRSNEVLLRRV